MVDIEIMERASEADHTECMAQKLHIFNVAELDISSKNSQSFSNRFK